VRSEPAAGRPDDEARRAHLRSELAALLPRKGAEFRGRVLGAGSDDFESGRRHLRTLADGGYAVPTWPVDHGGMGLSRAEADIVKEILDEFETPDMYPFLVGLDLIGPTILAHATAEQQARWLAPLRAGEDIWCQMFSEPDAGSDLANVKARAERDGDTWRVSGSKVWTSRAHYAQRGLLLARSDPTVPKHRGITAFGLDMSSPGVTVRPLVQMNGDAHFNEVFLDDVAIPDSDRIGQPGDGWRVAITCLSHERGSLAGDLGIPLERILTLADQVPGPTSPWRDRVAAAVVASKVNTWSGLRAQAAAAAGHEPGPEGSLAKLRSNRLLRSVSALGVALEGPAAAAADSDDGWVTAFLVSPSLGIRGGTDEIQHNIIGERVLGLPVEPRVDKDRPFHERPG